MAVLMPSTLPLALCSVTKSKSSLTEHACISRALSCLAVLQAPRSNCITHTDCRKNPQVGAAPTQHQLLSRYEDDSITPWHQERS